MLSQRLEIDALEVDRLTLARRPERSETDREQAAGAPVLPDLPVKLIVRNLAVRELVLGEPVIGAAAQIAILTVSDTRVAATDRSGDTLAARVQAAGHTLVARGIVPDDRAAIEAALRAHIADPGVDVVLLTGGTGLTGRAVTPEAVHAVMDKEIPGFGELFRFWSYAKIGTSTIQSRALGAVAGGTYVFALPGSPGACAPCLARAWGPGSGGDLVRAWRKRRRASTPPPRPLDGARSRRSAAPRCRP